MTIRVMRRGRRAALLALVAGLGLLAGGCFGTDDDDHCTGPPGVNPHRQLWRLQGIHDYQYVWAERCYCLNGGHGPFLVQVRNDAVSRVWSIEGDSLLPNNRGATIDDLFDVTELRGWNVDAVYHPVLGYPMRLNLDRPEVVDEERFITVSRLSCDIVPPASFCRCGGTGDTLAYRFTALDSTGIPLVEGCLNLVFRESPSLSVPERIEGTRCLDVLGTLPAPYAFLMADPAEGGISQWGDITIDLNGRTADSNIILTGRFDGAMHGDFRGRWVYLTFHGEADRGTFIAVRGE